MTPHELQELIKDSPFLYHMAMKESWPLIKEHGLLPTSKLLGLFEVKAQLRAELTEHRRGRSVTIKHEAFGEATVRDQIPMHEADLIRCLQDGLTPRDWYQKLNERVFFWLTTDRLKRLLCAGEYRKHEHVVLKVDTRSLIEKHRREIELSPMNSGCTRPFAHPRGASTFLPIETYPYSAWRRKRRAGERVVELTVIGGVPDIAEHTLEVSMQSCSGPKTMIWQRP